ncbi:MAG: zinc finger domain-containing protein [Candidatus Nezhaarchaeales archaeon]
MSKDIPIRICSSCKKPVKLGEIASKFYCPQCGEVLIWRCTRCRRLVNPYKCPKCGFQGP